jgi:hypothetical protein
MSTKKRTSSEVISNNDFSASVNIKKPSIFTINTDHVVDSTESTTTTTIIQGTVATQQPIFKKPVVKKPIVKKPVNKKPSLTIDNLVVVAEKLLVAEKSVGMTEGRPVGMTEGRPVGMTEGRPVGMTEGRPVGMTEGRPVGMTEGRPVGMTEGRPIVVDQKPVSVAEKPITVEESANIQSSNRAKEPLVENPGLGDIYKQVIKLRLQDHQNLKTLFMMTNTIMNDVKSLKKYTHLLNVDRKHNMTITELMDLCDTLNGESEEIMVSWFVSLFQDRPDSFRDLANLMNDAITTATSRSSSMSSTHYDHFSIQNIMESSFVCNPRNCDSELYFQTG